MTSEAEYIPSPRSQARNQVEQYEGSGGLKGTTLRGMPVVIVTCTGAKTGAIRKVPLMRVEHDGEYLAVASLGGAPKHPVWYYNLVANPAVTVQDGPETFELVARELDGDEYAQWWERGVAAYPDYAAYQKRTARTIPLFVLERPAG